MFAVCIEKNTTHYGDQLLAHAKQKMVDKKGLATMPYEKQTLSEVNISNNLKSTCVEQSIFDDIDSQITNSADRNIYVIGWLRIDNRSELLVNLGFKEDTYSDRELILAGYSLWKENIGHYLVGDFSFVILDSLIGEVLLVRDHFGVRPLYYYQSDNCIVITSSIAVIKAIPTLALTVAEEYIVKRCMSVSADWSKTPFEQVNKVPPAHFMYFNVKNDCLSEPVLCTKYYQFDSEYRLQLDSENQYIEAYQSALNKAVKSRVSEIKGVIASESSGGIDSSSVTALAAENMDDFENELYAFGYVLCEQEEECINMLSDFVGIKHTHLITHTKKDALIANKEAERFIDYAGILPTAYIAPAHAPLYERAKNVKSKVLLSGFGGDEFVTNYAATTRVELLIKGQWSQWFKVFEGGFFTKRLRAFKWYFRYLWRGNIFETATALSKFARKIIKLSVINISKRKKYKVDEKILKNALYDAGCLSVNEFSLSNRWSSDMTARLEDCSLSAAAYGLEYRWPLLDIRLVEVFLSIPSEYKLRNGLPRYLHRKSVQGTIPEHLIWKDKDMGSILKAPAIDPSKADTLLSFDRFNIDSFPPQLKCVIDKEKWLNMYDQLQNIQKNPEDITPDMEYLMMNMQPVVELSEWLHSLNQE